MSRPLLYELNTRCWLRELSDSAGEPVRLGNVPDSEFRLWQRLGVTHLWLMGVWEIGPLTRARYLNLPDTSRHLQQALPDWCEQDVCGSPYAIAEYRVAESLGGDEQLRSFRERLRQHDIKVLLDFVPNHLGLDHPWVRERPELFVRASREMPEVFCQEATGKTRWLAHGKDPYFPAWIDTVQLDYRRADTRAAMIEQLRSVASRCDGVRCDMAMLLLNDVFRRNWKDFPEDSAPVVSEFWAEAIAAVKCPDFLLLAEAYWDLEERLQSLGFDFTYDKRVADFLVEHRGFELQRHLLGKTSEFQRRSVHFLENHDEPRIASRLSLAEHRVAALLILALPGMTLLHEGQLTGARIRASVHVNRRQPETIVAEVALLYHDLLAILPQTAVGQGEGMILRPIPTSLDEDLTENLVVVHWRAEEDAFDLAVMNPGQTAGECLVELPSAVSRERQWRVFDWLKEGGERRPINLSQALHLKVAACDAQLLHFSARD